MTSNFYSGFCLSSEEDVFDEYIVKNDFTIQGFSYGAIKAFKNALKSNVRVDTIQLFSPAFFQTKDKKFVRMQLMFFKKDSKNYCDNFLKNISYPSSYEMSNYFIEGSYEELEELLTYKWCEEELTQLLNRGTKIEVYLGEKDIIIDSSKAYDFFKNYASVYFIKNVGHILKEKE